MRSDRRPRVGLLLDTITDPRDVLVWSGVLASARDHGASVLCFDCGRVLPTGLLSSLVGAEALDGLVVHLRNGDPSRSLTRQDVGSLPVVNVAHLQEGQPSILSGSYQGMRSLLLHLIEVHEYRHLAFVQDTTGDVAAKARYRAYVDVLSEYGLPRPAAFVAAAGEADDAQVDLTENAVAQLMDRGAVVPDVIACSTDATALGLLRVLSRRGLRVPDDIAVTGFDDAAEGQTAWPALTTVAQPWRRMGARAVELLLAQLEGDPVPAQMVLPCELIVRESCGCWPAAVIEAGLTLSAALRGCGQPTWSERRTTLLAQVTEALAHEGTGIQGKMDLARMLVDDFAAEIEVRAGCVQPQGEESAFLSTLRSVLQEALPGVELNRMWQTVLSLLWRHMLASPDAKGDGRARAEALIEQARVMVADASVRAQATHEGDAVQRARAIERVGTSVSTHSDMARLSAAAARELPEFGIAALYLFLYKEEPASDESCRLVAGYDREGSLDLDHEGLRFRLPQLLPVDLLTSTCSDALLAAPLLSERQELGYVLFEAAPGQAEICHSLQSRLSSTLQSLRLLQRTKRDAMQLQTVAEVGRVVSSMLDPEQLMQTVVDIVLERLGLYYVGLFVVDESGSWTSEPGRWAVLRAGTGQAGRQMLAKGHKLEVGGASMVGQCIAQAKARIGLDVGKEPVRADSHRPDNPLLPYTRSELALPLVSRERLLGAMTIQSVQVGAFGTQDIDVLQPMADQMANAIDTAHLYAAAQETLQRTQILYETSRTLSATLGEDAVVSAILDGLGRQPGCVYAVLFTAKDDVALPSHPDARALCRAPAKRLELRGGTWQGKQGRLPDWLHARYVDAEGEPLASVYASGAMRTVYGWDDRIGRRHYEHLGVQHLVRVLAPIRRRDETVGVVEVAYDATQSGTTERQGMGWLAAYLDQAAVALENAQLLAQLRQRLRREQVLREVSDRIRGALDVESVMQTTVAEVNRVLGRRAFIRLNGTTVSVVAPLQGSEQDA